MSGIFKPPVGAQLRLDHPLARGLVGCWLFNEGAGDKAHDYSRQGNVGTLTGFSNPPSATSGWSGGPHGGALIFDGNNDRISTPGNSPAFVPDGFTAIFHILYTAGSYCIPCGWTNAVAAGNLYYRYSARPLIYLGNSNFRYFSETAPSSPYDGLWHTVAFVVPGGGQSAISSSQMFIDGKEQSAYSTSAGGPQDARSAFFIGSSNRYTPQAMSYLYLFNRALSAAEISFIGSFPYAMFDEYTGVEHLLAKTIYILGSAESRRSRISDPSGSLTALVSLAASESARSRVVDNPGALLIAAVLGSLESYRGRHAKTAALTVQAVLQALESYRSRGSESSGAIVLGKTDVPYDLWASVNRPYSADAVKERHLGVKIRRLGPKPRRS